MIEQILSYKALFLKTHIHSNVLLSFNLKQKLKIGNHLTWMNDPLDWQEIMNNLKANIILQQLNKKIQLINLLLNQETSQNKMSFLNCIQTPYIKQSQPTTPVTLKGKKKNRKMQKQTSSFHIQQTKIRDNTHSIGFWKQKVNKQSIGSLNKNVLVYQSHPFTTNTLIPDRNRRQYPVTLNQTSKQEQKGIEIRRKLDENLFRQYKTLNERRLSVNLSNRNNIRQMPFIPKLQKNLVNQYIQLIYKDYLIEDPLIERKFHQFQYPHAIPNQLAIPQLIKQQIPIKKRNSNSKTKKSKKAVELKQSFLIQMFCPQQQSNQNNQSDQYSQMQSPQKQSNNRRSSSGNTMIHSVPIQYKSQQKVSKEISQIFRYCFICEQLILQANIQIHQREKCPQFGNLYQMSFKQIKNKLMEKIRRIKQQTEQLHSTIFEVKNEKKIISKLNTLKNQTINYLNNVNNNLSLANSNIKINLIENNSLRLEQQNCKSQLKYSFANVMLSYEESYFELYEKLRKLHWFNLMLKNLEIKYGSNLQSINKNQIYMQHRRNSSSFQHRKVNRPYKQVYL